MSAETPDQRGLCQHCGMWAYWDGSRWRHELSRRAACPNGRTNAAVDALGEQDSGDAGSSPSGGER